ncbi:MAG TPA: phosphotransferase, partial [Micromonosporaceae bacterium]
PEGPRAMVVMERVEGRTPVPPFAPGLHRAHGRLIAAIHRAGESFRSPHRRAPRDLASALDRPLREILPMLSDEDATIAADQAERARRWLTENAPTRGIVHGDATMDNVLIVGGTEDDPELVVFDFDLAAEAWLAVDFPFFAKNWPHFRDGYAEVRDITSADLAAQQSLGVIDTIESIRFHAVTKPQWRGAESQSEGWLEEALGDLREP